jgi:fructose-1-phosphate kinase PfkB-like protein
MTKPYNHQKWRTSRTWPGGGSLTAGIAAGLARGADMEDALRLGAAAGALNVTRRGLGTGSRHDIENMARLIQVHPLESGAASRAGRFAACATDRETA